MRLKLGRPMDAPFKASIAQRIEFLEGLKGRPDGDCIMWPYGKGRGSIKIRGKRRTAASAMCEIETGIYPPELEVAHSCNRGAEGCVHPAHLRWATHTENMRDKFIHGTQPMGDTHYKRKNKTPHQMAGGSVR